MYAVGPRMKIFWSWQSDTPGKTGRHFVRDALAEAVKVLKQPDDVEEPHERELREAISLDHDRLGVSGTPPLAQMILEKIDKAQIFVADVTLVGSVTRFQPIDGEQAEKKLINSNVAIEYGHAIRAVGDEMILFVQNTHYGNRDDLPFDLKHKGGPIQYKLAPNATKPQIAAEKAKLVGALVVALRACLVTLARSGPAAPKFEEIASTTNRAFFWKPGELLAQYGVRHPPGSMWSEIDDDVIEYRFGEHRALYLRLIPTVPNTELFKFGELMDIVERGRVRVMTNTMNGGQPCRNTYGAVSYQSSGSNTTPVALTQLHRNGEIWAVTREHWGSYAGDSVVTMGAVERRVDECLANSIEIARTELSIEPPYEIEIGIVGLNHMRLARPREQGVSYASPLSDYVHDDFSFIRRVLNDVDPAAQAVVMMDFLRGVYALAAIDF